MNHHLDPACLLLTFLPLSPLSSSAHHTTQTRRGAVPSLYLVASRGDCGPTRALFNVRAEAKQNDRKLRIIICGWVRPLCWLPLPPIVLSCACPRSCHCHGTRTDVSSAWYLLTRVVASAWDQANLVLLLPTPPRPILIPSPPAYSSHLLLIYSFVAFFSYYWDSAR